MASGSEYSSSSESDTPIAKKKRATGSKADGDDFSFKNVLRPPRSTTYTAQALYDQIVEGVIDLDPHYQRDVVWSEIKQIGLVDSIFRNFYIPPIIFAVSQSSDGTERRVCIDGKQRLTSIQKFMDGLIYHKDEDSKRKYWYKQKAGKPGKQLPPKYKRMFSNKQIVCIEYMEITEDDEREIFRRVQLGMALNYAEKMKAEAPTPRQTLIHELVQEFSMSLRSLGFNDRRDAAFRWIAQSLQTVLDPRPIIKRTTSTTAQQTTWLKDTAPLDPAWKKRVQHSYKLLIDTLSAYPDCLKVSRGPATIAPIDLVMMVLLVFEFHEKLSPSRLADALHALRMAARRETKDLMWKGEHMSYYLVFLDRLERLGEAAMNTGGGKDAQMDVDPPPKRQRTGDYTPTSLSSPVSSVPSAAVPSRSTSTPQRRAQLQQASQFPTPRQPSAVPPSPITVPAMMSAPVSSPVQAQASAGLAALESALATFPYPLPPTNTDRLASIRAAKVAILNGQHQLPGRPAPIGGSNSFGGGGGPSRGGARK
ncbi:hypothetical protein EDB92DRAFT_2112744 [Lactarius akahatsu]|uniref:GmrSD restriction endonucleases N-terminal domain-containing protein n=1 Tax=Lactarius akahatsu TaxID=416441 RepID=A0AAD4LL88_9AGAM|nr:hypothetical protein EDB92DRAFT_2112744 [Lactarius akahatsu]